MINEVKVSIVLQRDTENLRVVVVVFGEPQWVGNKYLREGGKRT